MDSYVHGKPLWDGIVAWYAFPNAYQTIIPSHINLQCTAESCSASTHAYNHALVSDSAAPNLNSALPNLTSKFASAFSNAYQTTNTIPNQLTMHDRRQQSIHVCLQSCLSVRFGAVLELKVSTSLFTYQATQLLIPISDTC